MPGKFSNARVQHVSQPAHVWQHGRLLFRQERPAGTLEVREKDDLRWYTLGGDDIQSMMRISAPQELVLPNHRYMLAALALSVQPRSLLNLGFGGGAFERYLHAELPDLAVHSIEIEADHVALARRFFAIPAEWPVEISAADAYLCATKRHYDIILCDLFAGQQHAECLYEASFYALLAARLGSAGVVALNLSPVSEEHMVAMLLAMRAHFPTVQLASVPDHGNLVALLSAASRAHADPQPQPTSAQSADWAALLPEFHVLPARG